MINGYNLEYLKENRKLTKQEQQEIKELMLKELINKACANYIEAKCDLKKNECLRLSKSINKLTDTFKWFNNVRYDYKNSFIWEIRTFVIHQDMYYN